MFKINLSPLSCLYLPVPFISLYSFKFSDPLDSWAVIEAIVTLTPITLTLVGKPCTGEPYARFDEGG